MSGPKVIRVVTREELVAASRAALARLDAAIGAWTRDGRRNDAVSERDLEAVRERRERISNLLEQNRFVELQKAVQEEIAFLAADQQDRLQKAAAAEARARTAIRREQDAARAVLNALRHSGRDVPVELQSALEDAARGIGDVSAAVSAGFGQLGQRSGIDAQRLEALAAALKGDDRQRTLEAWLSTQSPPPDEAALARVEAGIGELAAVSGSTAVAAFEERIADLRTAASTARGTLLLDSLALDLGRALAEARKRADTIARLDQALAELGVFDPKAAKAIGIVGPGDLLSDLEAMRAAAEGALLKAREAQAAQARREAVLQALAELGYEVGEALDTAWVENGRVVLRRPAQPGYGVELAGGANAERLQMRVVSFGEGAGDPTRDRDAETLWCGDVSVLQARLAAAGAALTIEKALPVGATPVKRLPAVEDRSLAREGRAPQARTLG